jgi:hypothetical protein
MAEDQRDVLLLPSRWKVALGASCCLCLLATCACIARGGGLEWFGRIGAISFGLLTIAWLGLLHPRARLELTNDRLVLGSAFAEKSYKRKDIESFGAVQLLATRFICIRLRGDRRRRGPSGFLNRVITGHDLGVPNVFEIPPAQLLDLLDEWLLAGSRNGDEPKR